MSSMSITVLASEVTIGNNGYPYGTMAYSFFEDNTRFDVIGQINGAWVEQTSYDKYWNFYTSTEASPVPLEVRGTGPMLQITK